MDDSTLAFELIEKTKPGAKILAWPLASKFKDGKLYTYPDYLYGLYKIQDIQYKHGRGVTKEEMEKGPEEVYLDFSEDPRGEYKYFVRDLTESDPEVKERVKEETDDQLSYLHLFIDTISHGRFHRRLHKTKKFL
jgi:hypothetical protein